MDTKVNTDGYGTFGNLSTTYDEIRPTMPDTVIDALFAFLPSHPHILDAGCGTGIITRQLVERGATVTGTDIDARMIEQAKRHHEEIEYLVAQTEALPLPDATCDAVTAFSAFHWFANAQAVSEIQRVLKSGGYFFVANRNQVGNVRKEYLQILQSFVVEPLPNAKRNYEPTALLKSSGFEIVLEKNIPIVEHVSVEQAFAHVCSTSLWNVVPEREKPAASAALRDFFTTRAVEGLVPRPIEIQIVAGKSISR